MVGESSSSQELREQGVAPHVAQNNRRRSRALEGRTTRPRGYAIRQKKRPRGEEIFGWLKMIGRLRKVRPRGRELVKWMCTDTVAAYNLLRMTKLRGRPPERRGGRAGPGGERLRGPYPGAREGSAGVSPHSHPPLKGEENQTQAGFADINLLPTKNGLDFGVHLRGTLDKGSCFLH